MGHLVMGHLVVGHLVVGPLELTDIVYTSGSGIEGRTDDRTGALTSCTASELVVVCVS